MELEQVINVKMDSDKSILRKNYSYEETALRIANHLIKSRSTAQPVWRPYIMQEGIYYRHHSVLFDGKAFYPDCKPGDVVYVSCNIWIEKDYEVWINLIGMVQVFLDGECIFASWERAEQAVADKCFFNLPVKLSADRLHNLVIKTVCTADSFGFELNISPPRCPGLWANFYLVLVRLQLPIDGFTREEGMAVSPLYSVGTTSREAYELHYPFEEEPKYAFPEDLPEKDKIDFADLYHEGNVAFAYAVAEEDGFALILADSLTKVIVNGITVATLRNGKHVRVELQAGDQILIKSMHEGTRWGFTLQEKLGIGQPMIDTQRKGNFTFALCGPFFQGGMEVRLPPEQTNELLRPFPDGRGGRVFWRYQTAYLRAYLDSSFFGQWYYATMLSFNGIRCCGETFDIPQYMQYFLANEEFLSDWSEYAAYDSDMFGFSQFMYSFTQGEFLDHIGTMGVNFIEAYRMTGDRRYLNLIRMLQYRIKHEVPRFEDGTFRRNIRKTMWADDFYMSGAFLTQLYTQMGDEDSLKDILCQLDGFVKRLYMPESKIFSHIYFWDKGVKNEIPWGRGNGWIAFSMSEMLMRIPEHTHAHEKILNVFCLFCEGLAELQDDSGLWHQVLDKPDSYLESSCTAMFTLAFYRGVRNGWLPESFRKNADRGLQALLQYCIDEEGVVYDVCMGSSCAMDVGYYFNLPTIKDDNHGTGIVLMLLCERAMMERESL